MFGLMDCNNFFVSCERLFRPDLARKPVVVLSSNDGCVVSRSQEVKDLGISMGIPYFQIEKTCKKEGIAVFSSNFTLYRDISARVMESLREAAGAIEIYSVDEAFFVLDKNVTEADITKIRGIVMQKTGIPVSIGAGATKTIAKAASEVGKKGSGVSILDARLWREHQKNMSCGSVWGIGRKTTAKLSKLGIGTVSDLLAQDQAFLKNLFGVFGERLYLELSGSPAHLQGGHMNGEQGSIMSSRSFKTEITDRALLESAIGYHVTQLGEKLRAEGLVTATLTVYCLPSRFGPYAGKQIVETVLFPAPTNETAKLLKEARTLFACSYEQGVPYKKAGARVSDLIPSDQVTRELFNASHDWNEIDRTVDALNERFGHGAIRHAVVQRTAKWQSNTRFRSPEYTTRWSDIPISRAH